MGVEIMINGVVHAPIAANLNEECRECDLLNFCTNVDNNTNNAFSRVCLELTGEGYAFKKVER